MSAALGLAGIVMFVRAGFGGWFDAWLLVATEVPERSGGARVLAGLAAFVAGTYGLIDAERAERVRRRNTELELEVLALTAELARCRPAANTGVAQDAEPGAAADPAS